jgi:outer membrane protein OmpA-like peptidoglycan-associated protein
MTRLTRGLKPVAAGLGAVAFVLAVSGGPVAAQQKTETYIPAIWIDPDGCEHWAMDDGTEGYMDNRMTRDGRPVCHRNVCGVLQTDTLFATDSARLTATGRSTLQSFFTSAQARSFIITGHTDSRASDEHNMRLSKNRAEAVAGVAQSVGAPVLAVNWYGERMPKATNATAAGMAQNRRVEVICVK